MMAKNRLPDPKEDFPAWYVEVVKQAGMAEHGLAKGTMVIKPHGYAVWEHIQRALDDRFKATGHENLYFPMLFPESLLHKEAEHVEGFSPQVAVVTHGGGQKLDEPLVIRGGAASWPAGNTVASTRSGAGATPLCCAAPGS